MNENTPLSSRDWLAIERTKLANERTFLAYFRTFVVILGSGITVIKLDLFEELKSFGFVLLVLSPIILALGIYRLFRVKHKISKYYKN